MATPSEGSSCSSVAQLGVSVSTESYRGLSGQCGKNVGHSDSVLGLQSRQGCSETSCSVRRRGSCELQDKTNSC